MAHTHTKWSTDLILVLPSHSLMIPFVLFWTFLMTMWLVCNNQKQVSHVLCQIIIVNLLSMSFLDHYPPLYHNVMYNYIFIVLKHNHYLIMNHTLWSFISSSSWWCFRVDGNNLIVCKYLVFWFQILLFDLIVLLFGVLHTLFLFSMLLLHGLYPNMPFCVFVMLFPWWILSTHSFLLNGWRL